MQLTIRSHSLDYPCILTLWRYVCQLQYFQFLRRNLGRVGHWRSGYRSKFVFPVSPRFLWECHTISTIPYLQHPLIKPYVQFSRIRLSDRLLPQAFAVLFLNHLALRYSFLWSSRIFNGVDSFIAISFQSPSLL